MNDVGFEALAVLLVLLPGFLSARIVQSLCVRPLQTELDKIVEALLHSFLIYVIYAALVSRAPLGVRIVEFPGGTKEFTPLLRTNDLFCLLGISIILGLLISASVTNDLHGRLFRKLRLTQRTTRSSVWSDVFHDWSYYVQVQFADGRKIIGWPRHYSDTPEESALFLENAAWIGQDGKPIDVPGPGILITRNMPIESIMFLKGLLVKN